MSEEVKAKKNLDYSASAVNLTNAVEVKILLDAKARIDNEIRQIQTVMQAYPEWQALQELGEKQIAINAQIRAAVDQYGSDQDVSAGVYAVKQIRKTVTFIAEKIRQVIPQYAEAVIDGVNTEKMKGLIKGGLISSEQSNSCSAIKESFAYIIK